jgi:hypothetical protein
MDFTERQTDEEVCVSFCHAAMSLAGCIMAGDDTTNNIDLIKIFGGEIGKRNLFELLELVSNRVEPKLTSLSTPNSQTT